MRHHWKSLPFDCTSSHIVSKLLSLIHKVLNATFGTDLVIYINVINLHDREPSLKQTLANVTRHIRPK